MRPLQSLTLEAIVSELSTTFRELEDPRAAHQLAYPLHATLMSGFALMFFQHPSLLQFQRAMKQKRRRCNLETIFGVTAVPSDTQMREILDGVNPEPVRAVLPRLWEKVRRAGWGPRFKTTLPTGRHRGDYYTVALDGSEYFHSTKIQCPHCLRRTGAQRQVHYSHQVVAATVVRAGSHQVVPLDAEEVRNLAGKPTQDCELNAGKRLIERLRQEHPQMALILTGDDLYAHVPFVAQLQQHRLHYVLVAKPASHPFLWERVEVAEQRGQSQHGQWQEGTGAQRRTYAYRIVRAMPLAFGQAVRVTFVEVWERNAAGQLRYHNSWITDLDVEAENVAVVVAIGRTRWKIENEPCNVQKNHGYELTHNYGHGQKTLAMVCYLLNLLAYVTHVILELGDRVYQRCRAQESRRELWAALRTLFQVILVERWPQLLRIYLEEEAAGP